MTVFSGVNKIEFEGTFEGIGKDVVMSQMIKALQKHFPSIRDKNYELSLFLHIFQRYVLENTSITHNLNRDEIRLPSMDQVVEFEDIKSNDPLDGKLLSKLAILKLSGKTNLTIGKESPLFEVKNGMCSLDITVQQTQNLNAGHNSDVPLIFMTSLETESQISNFLEERYPSSKVRWKTVIQSSFPSIDKGRLLPIDLQTNPHKEDFWYPCGTGNLADTLYFSGELDELIAQGKEILFVSNIDNLGATVDLNILDFMINKKIEYLVEVVERTANDSNTEVLATYKGKLRSVCYGCLPNEYASKCRSVNTNNIWIDLRKLKCLIESNSLNLPIRSTETKIIHGHEEKECLNFKTQLVDCIAFFPNSRGIKVTRNRFLPLKTCRDLFLLKSTLYDLDANGTFNLYPLKFGLLPSIDLGDEFATYETFNIGIPDIPDILELDHLTVMGNVFFGRKITLKGTVIMICDKDDVITVPDGSILENVTIWKKSQLEDMNEY
ncbi:BBM_1a_G0023070.mRNA.1.CDS.1 [Saccharomyces cerevisiae]|nr:BBM_1a_G0023070.mRNA.1.CDS.1 [Saccharomyces cerevisiae]CAI7143248.1 BBM_1a_G0023070.mRNA.1.CDS.1 [Saccharomyces cerevisiae]